MRVEVAIKEGIDGILLKRAALEPWLDGKDSSQDSRV